MCLHTTYLVLVRDQAAHGSAQIAVCTPGRMIDLIKMKACTCRRVTYLVFDEADRMFDMGFEPQVQSHPKPAAHSPAPCVETMFGHV